MKAMEQINALKTLSIDPVKYLVLPRVFSGMLLMPLLMLISNTIAMLGSLLIMTLKFDIAYSSYIIALTDFFEMHDFYIGLLKSLCFGKNLSNSYNLYSIALFLAFIYLLYLFI